MCLFSYNKQYNNFYLDDGGYIDEALVFFFHGARERSNAEGGK